jgi:PKD repeat protein
MKKLVLLSLVSLMATYMWAAESNQQAKPKAKAIKAGAAKPLKQNQNNKPKSARSAGLQTVVLGTAGNINSVLESYCHQIDVDSLLNTVLFIHRSDTTAGSNIGQYRYDISKNGGASWQNNIGPLNPAADNITVGGRYPQAVLHPDSAYRTSIDSAYIVYNGTWNNVNPGTWEGQYYGVGQLSANPATFTEHDSVVNNGNVDIAGGMIESLPGHFWNLNLDYTEIGTTSDTIRGLIIERGLWNDSAKDVFWTYQDIPVPSALIYSTTGTVDGNNLYNPTIAFDPTGKYGYILMLGDITNDLNYTTRPILMKSTDYGQTWSAPQDINIENLPGIFTSVNPNGDANTGKTLIDARIAVDSAANPHIIAIVAQTDTTANTYEFYVTPIVLYDLYYNSAVSGCTWQANFLSQVYGFEGDYTADDYGITDNRLQVATSKDGTKIFAFWTDTDSSIVASLLNTGANVTYTNTSPNLFGIGIDMSTRQITNVTNVTAGNAMFGGQVTNPAIAAGTLGGATFPVISVHPLPMPGGVYNIPIVLTELDYLDASVSTKQGINAVRFWYGQNVNFSLTDFVNKFDNAAPSLAVDGPDTVWVELGQPYTLSPATAFDCTDGNVTVVKTSTVPTNVSGVTDSIGLYSATYSATSSSGNTTSQSQVVIVAAPPIAKISYTQTSEYTFTFTDVSLNFDTARKWTFGDNGLSYVTPITHRYQTTGPKTVTLTVWNRYGSSSDTVEINVSGINDIELANKISVYPNPSTGMVTMEMTSDIANGATVFVYNVMGELTNNIIDIKPNTTSATLNLNNLDPGVYLLKVQTPTGTAIKQIIISK